MRRPHRSPFRFAVPSVCPLLALGVLAAALPAADDRPPAGAVPLKGHTESVYAVAFTPDGRHVVTGSFDHTLKVWEAATGKEVKTFGGTAGHQNLVLGVAVSPDGTLIASGSSDNTAKIWDFPTGTPLRELDQGDAALALAVSPDGKTVAAAGKGGGIRTWSAADGKPLASIPAGPAGALAWTPDGRYLAAAGAD